MSKQRLIDANMLTMISHGDTEDAAYDEGYCSAIYVFKEMIDEAPTIDAITVSWIEDQISQHTYETGWTDWWGDMCRRFLQEYERRRDDGNAN